MAPLIVLIVVTGISRLLGALGVAFVDSWSAAVALGLAAMFLMTALTHFREPRRAGLVAIVPPRLPGPALIVTATGVLELAGAIGIVLPATRTLAAICLGLLLIAKFPANVYAAGAPRHPSAPTTPIVRRTVYQLIFLAACVIVVVG